MSQKQISRRRALTTGGALAAGGTASSAERHLHTDLNTPVGPGDFLAFHMDHAGLQVDAEVQVVIGDSAA